MIDRDPNAGAWRSTAEGDRGDARAIGDRQAILTALAGGKLTRTELEEATGAPERQFHSTLEGLIDSNIVERTGAGKKGDPYRFSLLRTDAAQPPAQHRAEMASTGFPFSAASP